MKHSQEVLPVKEFFNLICGMSKLICIPGMILKKKLSNMECEILFYWRLCQLLQLLKFQEIMKLLKLLQLIFILEEFYQENSFVLIDILQKSYQRLVYGINKSKMKYQPIMVQYRILKEFQMISRVDLELCGNSLRRKLLIWLLEDLLLQINHSP